MDAQVIFDVIALPASTGTAPLRAYAPQAQTPSLTAGAAVGSQGGQPVVAVASMPVSASNRVPGPGDLLLGRVTLSRANVDVGYVLSDQEFSITVWNTDYTRAATLTSLDNSDPDAIVVNGHPPVFTLAPGAATTYSVKVKLLGKSTIADSVRFLFAELGENSPALKIFGTRMVIFPLSPDWDAGFDEQLTLTTSLLTTHSGVEQRALLRETPVRVLSYTVSAMDDGEAGQLEALLWGWQSRVFGVPVWTDERQLVTPAAEGSKVIYCDTSYTEMTAGGYLMVWQDSFTYDAVQIAAVQSDQVTLAFPLTKSYRAGAKVVPVSFARLDEQLSVKHDAAAVSAAQLTFTVE